jgi:single-strand DNA-binding protein
MSYNRIIILGNVGKLDKPVELFYTAEQTPYCSYFVATDTYQGGEVKTLWYRCTFWGKRAEVAQKFAAQGKPILVEGRPGVSEWVDREGRDRFTLEINVTDFQFAGEGNVAALLRTSEAVEEAIAADRQQRHETGARGDGGQR